MIVIFVGVCVPVCYKLFIIEIEIPILHWKQRGNFRYAPNRNGNVDGYTGMEMLEILVFCFYSLLWVNWQMA